MNINPQQIDQVLNSLPYPIGKDNLVQQARQHGANDQIIGMLDKLPNKTFNSADDLKSSLSGLGNLGGIKF
ncbi:DUF2795 domain-containing protein [Dictyobacter aurantiacus]|uniref:DUF2795 domain-containing protein n=1 Tax=Dictyobacter aurantiacus TaxID=1936993 RepID=A0A401ZD83_9CHLR|nr:DUF2795 domain-containing protein [Dictyobacter aurantiacus]GCE04809.1 hypothetical protein KDAU_21380 [Dictyobacter aurantiacus]